MQSDFTIDDVYDLTFLSASFLEKRGSLREGIQMLKKALKIEPSNVQALSFLSSLHRYEIICSGSARLQFSLICVLQGDSYEIIITSN